MLNEALGNTSESKSGYSAVVDLVCAAKPGGRALAWAIKRQGRTDNADYVIRDIKRSMKRAAITEENSAEDARPMSPEEKAEYYKEFEEARQENLEAMRRDIDEYVKEGNDRAIKQRIEDSINSRTD